MNLKGRMVWHHCPACGISRGPQIRLDTADFDGEAVCDADCLLVLYPELAS